MSQLTLLKTDAVLDVPSEVRLCPYCGARLVARFSQWIEGDDQGWMIDSVDLECASEPDMDEDITAWDEWFAIHSNMPYVYWLPATLAVIDWANANYRFVMD